MSEQEASTPPKRAWYRTAGLVLLLIVGLPLGFLTSCTATTMAVAWATEDLLYKQAVGSAIPLTLPVAVALQHDGKWEVAIVEYRSLNEVTDKFSSFTFLIPDQQQVVTVEKSVPGVDLNLSGSVTIQERQPGRQKLYVKVDDEFYDRVSAGWYDATEKTIAPHFHKYLGPGSMGFPMTAAFVLNVLGWSALCIWAAVRMRKRRTLARSPV